MRAALDARTATRTAGALLLLCSVVSAQDAHADLVSCPGIKEAGSKVLLDDFTGTDVDETVMTALLVGLERSLEQVKLESDSKVGAHSDALPATTHRAVRCPNRWPRSPADYKPITIRALNDYLVTLEVWADVSPQAEDAGRRMASVGYVLVPVRHYERHMPGVVIVPYKTPQSMTKETLLAMLDQSGRLAAYASIAAGVRLMNASKHDEARKYLCSAQARLMSLPVQGSPKDAMLLEDVAALAEEVVKRAREDPDYLGALKLTEGAACPLDVQ